MVTLDTFLYQQQNHQQQPQQQPQPQSQPQLKFHAMMDSSGPVGCYFVNKTLKRTWSQAESIMSRTR